MKITKLEHSCLLVEMPAPVNRTALFDPGIMSVPFVNIDSLQWLDDIIITHSHEDHMDIGLLRKLLDKFPDVRITTTGEGVAQLKQAGIVATNEAFEGVEFFDAPHEEVRPVFPQPENLGVHYLGLLTDPGDSHDFTESKAVLALPMTAPWGAMVKAVNLGLKLKPKYILPVHDWQWKDEAKQQTYSALADLFKKEGIILLQLANGEPVVIDV